jgi:hypothetical protein
MHDELTEWVDPEGSSVAIEPEAILRAGGRTDEEIAMMADEANRSLREYRIFERIS